MTRRIPTSLLAGAVLALSLAVGPGQVSNAAAQEAIMLETIGAVRMATPEEVRRNAGAAPSTREHRPDAVRQRHAAIVE